MENMAPEVEATAPLGEQKTSVETGKETVTSTPAGTPAPEKVDDLNEFRKKDVEIDDFPEERKSGFQKRIDKLTAVNAQLQQKLQEIEKRITPDGPQKRYTPDQLRGALEKAMTEQNPNLMFDVVAYYVEGVKEDLRNEYMTDRQKAEQAAQAQMAEWHETVKRYDYLIDPKNPEFYPNSRRDLNLKDKDSLLYRLASDLFSDPDEGKQYRVPGGMRQAVADALMTIIQKKGTASANKNLQDDALKLQKQLEREKLKNALPGSTDVEFGNEVSDQKETSPQDALSQYISERNRNKSDRTNRVPLARQ